MRKWYRVYYHHRGEPKKYRVTNIQAYNRDEVKRLFKRYFATSTAVLDSYKLKKDGK